MRDRQRQKDERDDLIELYLILGEAYRLKELFDDLWEMDNKLDAAGFLAFWCDLTKEAKIIPFIKFSNTVSAHWTGMSQLYRDKDQQRGHGGHKPQNTISKRKSQRIQEHPLLHQYDLLHMR